MDEYAEEIWKDRISSLIDTKNIKDKQSLLKEILKLKNPSKHSQGNPEAVNQLIKNINSLFSSKTLEKTIIKNILNTINLNELKKLSKRKPKIVRKAAIKRINSIIKYQKKSQERRTETRTIKKTNIKYKISKPISYTKARTNFIKTNIKERSNKFIAINFYKKFKIPITAEAIKSKKLRLKGTKT